MILPDSEDEDLDTPSLKHKCTEAAFAKAADASLKWEYDPSKETKFIKVVDDCTPVDYGIKPDLVPKVTDVIVVSSDGEESTKVFYQCKVCPHRGQNRVSMINHSQKCLNIKLQCFLCSYLADSAKSVDSHVKKEHPTIASSSAIELEEVSQKEAEAVVAAIALSQKQK